jgi:hypothetical protein
VYLWASFVVKELRNRTMLELNHILAGFSDDFEAVYHRMLGDIRPDRREFAATLLKFVLGAYEPFTLRDFGLLTKIKPVNGLPVESAVADQVSFCSHLLEIRGCRQGRARRRTIDVLPFFYPRLPP